MTVVVATLAAPWGPIAVAASPRAVVAAETVGGDGFAARTAERLRAPIVPLRAASGPSAAVARRALAALEAYLAGDPSLLAGVPVDLTALAPFDRDVLAGVRDIPFGRVTSYGRLAALVGRPGAARVVGGAVGRNPVGLFVPCHRVLAGDGSLGGYGGDAWGGREHALAVKRALLALEGVAPPVPREALLGPTALSAG